MIEAGPPKDISQPKLFAFTEENAAQAQKIMGRYPAGRQASAVIPLLQLAQSQHENWLPTAAMNLVAEMLGMPRIRVYEVASFYTMFNRRPVGKNHIQVCTTTPCWLRGSDALVETCNKRLGIGFGETSADGLFSMVEVECLGACVNAPMVQINDDYYEDLDAELLSHILDELKAGRQPAHGSQTGRRGACAQSGPTSLKEMA